MNKPTQKLKLLIADDQKDVTEALRLLLKSEGIACECVHDPESAIEAARAQQFSLALIDLNYTRDTTSGGEGMDLITRLRGVDAELPIVVMTAWATVDLAVQAMRLGAGDFVEKPWDNRRLLSVLHTQIALADSSRQVGRLRRANEILQNSESQDFVCQSPAMQRVLELVSKVAASDANVLVLGENGTGKGLIAKLIHANSKRSDRPLVKVNMSAIPEAMFEAEMFGHTRGAFTDAKNERIGRFEIADQGSLFLDEIGNIPLSQQGKLLRVLEDGEFERVGSSRTQQVQVRIISATNANLQADVQAGRFRTDLLFRLNTVEITIPPLRQRREDILPLADFFLARLLKRYGRKSQQFSQRAQNALHEHCWPGNVRELEHAIERAVLLSEDSQEIGAAALLLMSSSTTQSPNIAQAENLNLDEAESTLIKQALEQSQGNVQQAAELLGISRPALYRRLEKFGIQAESS